MNEALSSILPSEQKPAVVLPPPAVEPPSPALPPPSGADIRAVDRAFATEQEKTDAMAGLIGLWLSAPWLADLVADHLRKPAEEEEEEERKKDQEGEQHKCC